jgi:hypothetical protein
LRAVDSPKKQTNQFILFAFLLFIANKSNLFVRSFFGRIYGTPILLLVLSDLYIHLEFEGMLGLNDVFFTLGETLD